MVSLHENPGEQGEKQQRVAQRIRGDLRAGHYGSEIDDGINVHIVFGRRARIDTRAGGDSPSRCERFASRHGHRGDAPVGKVTGVLPQAFKELTGANALANNTPRSGTQLLQLPIRAEQPVGDSVSAEPTWDAIICGTASIVCSSRSRHRMISATCWMRNNMWTSPPQGKSDD